MTVVSWKLATELREDEMHEALYALQRRDCGPPFSHRYLRNEFACLVDVWCRVGDEAGSQHFSFEFQHSTDTGELYVGHHEGSVAEHPRRLDDVEGFRSEREMVGDQQDWLCKPMFVVVGEFVEHEQRVYVGSRPTVGSPVTSVVGLKLFDKGPVVGMNEFPHSLTRPICEPLGGGWIADRKVNPGGVGGLPVRGEVASQLPRELSESGVQVACDISYRLLKEVSNGIKIGNCLNAKDVVAGIHVEIGPETGLVRWVGAERVNVALERCQVSFRPLRGANGRS